MQERKDLENIESGNNKEVSDNESKGVGQEIWEIVKVIIISLAIVIPIRYFIIQPFIVRGASMEPNFKDKEYLLIDEISYYFKDPARGETIVFHYPRDPKQFFIKRIVGLPGERMEIKDGKVKIYNSENPDGFVIIESYLNPLEYETYPSLNVSLAEDEFFVLGDNRDFSSDSRIWGSLDRDMVVGRAVFRAWPFNRFGIIPFYGSSY